MTNQQRLSQLNNRIEFLIELNQKYQYTSNDAKCKQYLDLLMVIKKEKTSIWLFNRANNTNYIVALDEAKKANAKYLASISLSREDLFNLTAPNIN
jgi:hypothetical protein